MAEETTQLSSPDNATLAKVQEKLMAMKPWTLAVSKMGFVFSVLCASVGILLLVVYLDAAYQAHRYHENAARLIAGGLLWFFSWLGIGALVFVQGLLLIKVSTALRISDAKPEPDIEGSLAAMTEYWKFFAISVCVIAFVILLFIIIGIALAV